MANQTGILMKVNAQWIHRTVAAAILLLASSSLALASLKVFPGAQGFGTDTPAGRGGRVIRVTNLNDSGSGSLRDAVQTAGPRIILFEVGGDLKLANDLAIALPFVTVAGQSAPFPGIQISGGRITIQTHDVLLQHLRIRFGDANPAHAGDGSHALRVISGAAQVVIDHCTLMWAADEVASIWTNDRPIQDVTFSNNIIAEGLGAHGYGTLIGSKYPPTSGRGGVERVSIFANLYAHNLERNPSVSRDVSAVVKNNLCYNAGWEFMVLALNRGPATVSVIRNHCITGGSDIVRVRGKNHPAIVVDAGGQGSRIYLEENLLTGKYQRSLFRDETTDATVSTPPLRDDAEALPVTLVRAQVLRTAGAWPAYRDSAERRLIAEVRDEVGRHKVTLAEAGGWPGDYARMTRRSLTPLLPAQPQEDDDGDGYSNIEEVLQQMARAVENPPA